ncbi:MAG: DUF389 domain-containing protein [Caldilineaceae bacterium]
MRQLFIKVPTGKGEQVLALAREYEAINPVQMAAHDQEGDWDLVIAQVSNARVGPFLGDLESLPEMHVTLAPSSVLPMAPPATEVVQQIRDVSPRSPLEIWLNALQSIGSWKSYLGYTVAASLVVWIGMFTDTIFLLVAAMLIAPFAGPAMNVAVATASGDWSLLWRSVVRYFAALAVMVAVSALVSLLFQQQTATSTMVDISEVASVALLLPLVTGAAGALNLVQAESSSLVSGTAVGLLVAASLAPPAALIGMASAVGQWQMSVSGLYVLLLQLVGINIGGALVFRFYGLTSSGARYKHGRPRIFYASLAVTLILLAGLLFWQFRTTPTLQRSTIAQRAVGEVEAVLEASEFAYLVEANLRFTRPSIQDQNTLLGVVYVQRQPDVTLTDEQIRQQLTAAIEQQLLAHQENVTPLITVTVLDAPASPAE